MIAPTGAGLSKQMLIDRLNRVEGAEIVRTYAGRGIASAPIAVVRMSDETAAVLQRSAGRGLAIEMDRPLRPASFTGVTPQFQTAAMMATLSPGITVTTRVVTANGLRSSTPRCASSANNTQRKGSPIRTARSLSLSMVSCGTR